LRKSGGLLAENPPCRYDTGPLGSAEEVLCDNPQKPHRTGSVSQTRSIPYSQPVGWSAERDLGKKITGSGNDPSLIIIQTTAI